MFARGGADSGSGSWAGSLELGIGASDPLVGRDAAAVAMETEDATFSSDLVASFSVGSAPGGTARSRVGRASNGTLSDGGGGAVGVGAGVAPG